MSARGDLRRALGGDEPTGELRAIKASTIAPANVRWAWMRWIPLGMLSILLGLPGQGKTTVAELLAAEMTRGRLDGHLDGQPANVLIVSYEDALAETLVPRLQAADADLDRVDFLACKTTGGMLDLTRHLGDVDRMAQHFGARLLIIDPLVAGMPAGEINSHRDQDVRSTLGPLAALAARRDLAVLATMHFSKAATSALLGAGGSIGFVGAARSILVFGVDPTDERGDAGPARVLAHAKCNVGRLQRSRRVQVLPHVLDPFGAPIETSVAVLGETCDVSADDLVRVGKTTPRMNARRFLQELLADGPHRASEIYELAEDAGIAERTLKRAKGDLGVVSEKRGDGWWWRRPAEGDREGSDDDASDEGELS